MVRKTLRKDTRWTLNHINAASHTAMAVQQFLAEKQTALWLQPLYSEPCDFWLFPIIKMGHQGQCFATPEGITRSATASLHTIPRLALHECLQA